MSRTRVVALVIAILAVVGACSEPQGRSPQSVWRWQPPRTANVGMPGADARAVAITYGHWFLVLLDGAGKEQWQAERLGLRDVAPLLLADRVVAATDTGMAAFDRASGRTLWDVDLGDRANTPVLVATDRLAVTTWDGRLLVLDGATGALMHSAAMPGPAMGPGAAAGDVALASWDDGAQAGVMALDARTGAVRWRVPVDADGVSSPTVSGDNVVVVTGGERAVALAIADGHPAWARTTSGAGSPEVPPFAGDELVVADRLGGLLGLGGDAKVHWHLDGRGAAVRGGPISTGDTVAMPVDDGRVVLRRSDRVTVVDPPGRVSGVAAGPRGLVIVATRDAEQNELVAYR